MPVRIPELMPPLIAVSACANRISLVEHPDIAHLVPHRKTQETAAIPGGFISLLRETFPNGNVHFHLDVFGDASGEKPPEVNCEVRQLQDKFDALLGKTLHVNFSGRYLISANDMPAVSLVRMLNSGGAIKINNVAAALTVATLRLNDSVFSQVKWRQVDHERGTPPDFVIEINGHMGQMPVTPDLLVLAVGRVNEGLHRFVMPPKPAQKD